MAKLYESKSEDSSIATTAATSSQSTRRTRAQYGLALSSGAISGECFCQADVISSTYAEHVSKSRSNIGRQINKITELDMSVILCTGTSLLPLPGSHDPCLSASCESDSRAIVLMRNVLMLTSHFCSGI